MKQPRIILASESPRRAHLMRKLGLPFEVRTSGVDEPDLPHLSPRELTLRHAFAKARAVSHHFPDAIIIGADTIVVLGRRVFGKPKNLADAARMLQQLQGRTHRVVTGVCVVHGRKKVLFTETTAVTFRRMTLRQIQSYLRLIHPLDKAGAYAAQEHTDLIIARADGSFDNVVGLPTEKLRGVLRQLGINLSLT